MKIKKWQIAAVAAVVVIAVGVGCLFAGHAWGASGSSDNSTQVAGDGNGQFRPGDGSLPYGGSGGAGGRGGGNMVSGSIISVDSSSITVKTSYGSTKIVLLAGSTTISLSTKGSAADLKTGANAIISGTTNTDGTVTATSIRLGDVIDSVVSPPPGSSTTTE